MKCDNVILRKYILYYLNVEQPPGSETINSDCTSMMVVNGRWNARDCNSKHAYVCKKRGNLTTSTIAPPTVIPPSILAHNNFEIL